MSLENHNQAKKEERKPTMSPLDQYAYWHHSIEKWTTLLSLGFGYILIKLNKLYKIVISNEDNYE